LVTARVDLVGRQTDTTELVARQDLAEQTKVIAVSKTADRVATAKGTAVEQAIPPMTGRNVVAGSASGNGITDLMHDNGVEPFAGRDPASRLPVWIIIIIRKKMYVCKETEKRVTWRGLWDDVVIAVLFFVSQSGVPQGSKGVASPTVTIMPLVDRSSANSEPIRVANKKMGGTDTRVAVSALHKKESYHPNHVGDAITGVGKELIAARHVHRGPDRDGGSV
jgi:hypothetical protein